MGCIEREGGVRYGSERRLVLVLCALGARSTTVDPLAGAAYLKLPKMPLFVAMLIFFNDFCGKLKCAKRSRDLCKNKMTGLTFPFQ